VGVVTAEDPSLEPGADPSQSRRHATQGLLARAQGGDRAAYEALFSRVRDRLDIYVRCRLGGLRAKLDPADVVQDVYLQAHRSFGKLQSDSAAAFGAWLYRIADHTLSRLRDHHAAQKRGAGASTRGESALGLAPAHAGGPSTENVQREARERLVTAIQGLPEDQREVLILRHLQELTLAEVAARTGSSTSSVARLQEKAQQRLAKRLGFDFRERLG